MTKITNVLPEQCTPGFEYLFVSKQSYRAYNSKLGVLKNVFISHWGLMIKNGLMPLRTAENLIGCYDNTFYFSHYKKALEQFLVCKYGKSLPSLTFNDDAIYFTIHTPWFGYFSWFTSNLPRLIQIHEQFPQAILLLPEEILQMKFVNQSLALFPNLKIIEVKKSHHLFIRNYAFAQVKPWTSQFLLSELEQVRKICFDFLDKHYNSTFQSNLLYISRRKAKRRTITNETEVEEYLANKGFISVCYEDLSVFDQMALTRQARVLVSLHGAGLTNTIFMTSGNSVLELTPIPDKNYQFRFPFWRICDLLNINYSVQFCKTVDKGEEDIYTRDVTVDMTEFRINIERILQ